MCNRKWVTDFHTLYFNSEPEKRDEGQNLLVKNRPDRFCKYIRDVHIDSYLESFSHWYVNPDRFADKYDGLWYQFKIDPENHSPEQIEVLNFFLENHVNYETHSNLDKGFDDLRISLKLCSFTTNPLSLEMWKNYANDSKGICVEYDMNQKKYSDPTTIWVTLYPMLYSKEPCDISDFLLSSDQIQWNGLFMKYFGILKGLLKSSECEYENEWRSFIYNPQYSGPDNFVIPTGIYLGQKVSKEIKDKVLKSANENYYSVYQVTENETGIASCKIFAP